jgi:hypothetical protein
MTPEPRKIKKEHFLRVLCEFEPTYNPFPGYEYTIKEIIKFNNK